MVFLTETHCNSEQHKSLARAVGLPHIEAFDRVGLAGGVALLWDDSLTINIRDKHYYFIDVDVSGPEMELWRFTGFYGHPDTGQRDESWALLRSLFRQASDR